MKKYQVKINNMELEIIQDDDGKFITPYLCIEDWGKFGTALKPSFEPIIVARKPFKGSLVDNVIEYGVGGINIDECRVDYSNNEPDKRLGFRKPTENGSIYSQTEKKYNAGSMNDSYKLGRFPANTILTYDETDFDEVCGGFPNTKNSKRSSKYNKETKYTNTYTPPKAIYTENNTYGDSGSASRYFYCAKASKKDRDEGLNVEIEEYVLKKDTPKEIEQLILNSLTS